ncbi:MAG TPA: phytanoyl-CoA dioxygenase family protein [Holophagaceae bacterium]|nr:phytanoyl-CoA dioxygenase family protein [Holophagaceae bacterium]
MDWVDQLGREGWATGPSLDEASLQDLEALLPALRAPRRQPVPLGPLVAWLEGTSLPSIVQAVLGSCARPVRALAMAKEGGHNWGIDWHRDTTVLVAEMIEVPGFYGWMNKAHLYQAQAPREAMAAMLSTRIHLDPCGPGQGPLMVDPGSHLRDNMEADAPRTLTAARGGVLLMRPLLLHASGPATDPKPRRVLHIEWAADDLPGGLRRAWF